MDQLGRLPLRVHSIDKYAFQKNSVAASAVRHAFWTTGGRASGTPGSPAATLSVDTPGRLQRCSASDFTGIWLTPYLNYHDCWTTGERASDAPGPPAASRTSDTAGRLQRFSACSIIGARRTSDLERQACSNPTATCPASYLELSACWTTGERASDTPGSPVASFSSDTLGRPQHLLDCCFFTTLIITRKFGQGYPIFDSSHQYGIKAWYRLIMYCVYNDNHWSLVNIFLGSGSWIILRVDPSSPELDKDTRLILEHHKWTQTKGPNCRDTTRGQEDILIDITVPAGRDHQTCGLRVLQYHAIIGNSFATRPAILREDIHKRNSISPDSTGHHRDNGDLLQRDAPASATN